MRYLPQLNTISQSTSTLSAFAGLNRQPVPQDNEFSDMSNLCPDKYPALTARSRRYKIQNLYGPDVATSTEAEALCAETGKKYVFYATGSFALIDATLGTAISFTAGDCGYIRKYVNGDSTVYYGYKYTAAELEGQTAKLYYNKQLIRLISQPGSAYDVLNFGGKTIDAWQENELSRYSDITAEGLTVNDISIASIGAYVLFMPYKAWFNTETQECGKLESTNYTKADGDTVSLILQWDTEINGSRTIGAYTYKAAQDVTSSTPGAVNDLWYYSGLKKLYRCTAVSGTTYTWETVDTLRYKFNSANNGDGAFPDLTSYVNKFIPFSDFSYTFRTRNGSTSIRTTDIFDAEVEVLEYKDSGSYNSITLSAGYDGALIYSAEYSADTTNHTVPVESLSFGTIVPDMKYICAANNRMWGCDYDGHEIYASALGDMFSWQAYNGRVGDSWTATVGEGKQWTGAAYYNGVVHFFKKDRVFRVSGSKPANFGYTQYSLAGCRDNASIAVVADTLFYMGADGIYAYTGGTPTRISDKVGGTWKSGVAGGYKSKYYISRTDNSNITELLVYDTTYGTWHKESDAVWYSAFNSPETLYYTKSIGTNVYWYSFDPAVGGGQTYGALEDPLDWYGETGDLMDESPNKKYITRLDISLALASGSYCNIYIQYDMSGDWVLIKSLTEAHKDTDPIRFIPRRCNHFRLRFAGHGDFTLYSITKTAEEAREYV